MNCRLSILIPTIETRKPLLARLLRQLDRQIDDRVQVLLYPDDGEASISDKRNQLLSDARGEYVAFIDDDDQVSANYVQAIFDAIDMSGFDPDVVCIGVHRTCDGKHWGEQWHSISYGRDGIIDYGNEIYEWRKVPNHLCPVRRGLAQTVGFAVGWNNCEDSDYAQRLLPLLKTEVQVRELLYTYDFRANRPGERTNKQREKVEPPEILKFRENYWDNHPIVDASIEVTNGA